MNMVVKRNSTTQQYLTFDIGEERFAFDVGHVSTALEFRHITRLPRMPNYVRGIIDFRGTGLPVIDLHRKIGIEDQESSEKAMIIVLEIPFNDGVLTIGVTVDAVYEVIHIDTDTVHDAPSFGNTVDTAFIDGIGKLSDQFVIILNARKLFEDVENIQNLVYEH